MFKLCIIGCLLLSSLNLLSQSSVTEENKKKAKEKGRAALKLEAEGKVEEALSLFREAQQLNPESALYPYEIAYIFYMKEDYKGAIAIMEKILNLADMENVVYQLLGNSYDMLGNREKAMETYKAGLERFPTSGNLYLEMGNLYWAKEEYNDALEWYEKGIEIDPAFPSNYYRATRIYCHSNNAVWGMLYGEIFMSLEPNSKRTEEISKLLYDTYRERIKINSDKSKSYDFASNAVEISDKTNIEDFKLPFGLAVYEPLLGIAIAVEKSIDLDALNRIRTFMVKQYFAMGHDKKYPNILFDYQKSIADAGHLEAYNYWLLMKGDPQGFDTWQSNNPDKAKSFFAWFPAHLLKLDAQHRFYRKQY